MIEEIDAHCIGDGRYGFTVPYLFRIEKDADREKSITEILIFLSKQKKKYIIKNCEEFIIGLHNARKDAPIHMYDNFGNLFYDQDKIIGVESFNDLADFMIDKYQKRIDDETYSINYETKEWG